MPRSVSNPGPQRLEAGDEPPELWRGLCPTLASKQRKRNEIFCVIKEILRKINVVRTELRAKETGLSNC
jgi:hypothetical protein